jgi:glycosyltransferase involved in cell wall biosynthesis
MEALDVFALPSLSEALGYAAMEAMAMELPVVASAVGGIPEVVQPDRTGLLVPAGDGVALAGALGALVGSAEVRGKMGAAGRRVVLERFDERDMVRQTVELYRSMLRERRACA